MPTPTEVRELIKLNLFSAKAGLGAILGSLMSPCNTCSHPVSVQNLSACFTSLTAHAKPCIAILRHCRCGTSVLHQSNRQLAQWIGAFAPEAGEDMEEAPL